MEIIRDVDCDKVRGIIETQGHAAEHNFYHYINMSAMFGSHVFPVFGDRYGIMGFQDNDNIWCYSDPLAPEGKRLEIFMEFMEWSFENGAKKLRSELNESLWKSVALAVKGDFRLIRPSYRYSWPLYDLKKWDPTLSGPVLKKLRNINNSFQREHKINVLDREEVSRQDIINLIERWKENRVGADRTNTKHYTAAIDSNFIGYDSVRFLSVDGTICAMNGGWKIPNSRNFYSQLGVHDYSLRNLGEIMYMEDLSFLKAEGFDFADFGGSSPEMIKFKKKFFPSRIYKTIEFSIVRK